MPVALLVLALSAFAIGAPIMALLTARLPRKRTLILLMIIFSIGNVLCALAYTITC